MQILITIMVKNIQRMLCWTLLYHVTDFFNFPDHRTIAHKSIMTKYQQIITCSVLNWAILKKSKVLRLFKKVSPFVISF